MNRFGVLVLEDGEQYGGELFGGDALNIDSLDTEVKKNHAIVSAGEVVFNTGMTGYHEILTDPSYTGQIVTMTFPHIGNYGDENEWSEIGPGDEGRGEIKPAGMVIRSLYRGPVRGERTTLDSFLKKNNIPGLSEVDTRKLTLRLRDKGSPRGMLAAVSGGRKELSSKEVDVCVSFLESFPKMEGRNLLPMVGTKKEMKFDEDVRRDELLHIGVLDCGVKANILGELRKRNVRITLFPSTAETEDILSANTDGVLITNGPGDPAVLDGQIRCVKGLLGRVPLTGICLGHQLISLALGAKTYKMKFGHHGVNHPVRDELTGKVFVTSQNHGFAVDENSLPEGALVWFRNANDQSLEGILWDEKRIRAVQFHPEAAPGPEDGHWIFDSLLSITRKTPRDREE